METIKFSKLGKEDLQIGRGTFEVTLGDGRVATLNEVNLDSFDKLLSVEDASTNAVTNVLTLRHSLSSGSSPSAGIGTGLTFQAQSADEDPADLGGVEFAADDVTAGSEDSTFWIRLRAAGAALARKFGLRNTGTNQLLLSAAPTVDRTWTIQDATDVFVGRTTIDTLSNKTLTDALHNAGGGSETFRANGHILTDLTAASNTTTNEDTLITFSLPANSLDANGKGVRVRAWGTTDSTFASKTIRVYFGSTVLISNNISNQPVSQTWLFAADIFRTGANTQDAIATGQVGAIAQMLSFQIATEDTTGAIVIKVTGQGTAASQITAEGMSVEYLNS